MISDQDLIRAAREIGLISDIGYQQLDLIRYMRNYASAAHPNQNEINAYQLLGWIETCIKEVITLPETQLVAETKQLLHNVRAGTITGENAAATAEFFAELSSASSLTGDWSQPPTSKRSSAPGSTTCSPRLRSPLSNSRPRPQTRVWRVDAGLVMADGR